jgi:hypothetical protein
MGPISKATRARFYPFGAPSGNDRYLRILLRTPAIADPSNDRRGPYGRKRSGQFRNGRRGASPRPERRARPPTDHRDWNNLTNPDLSNGDDLTVSVRYTHGAFDPVPTMPRSAKLGIRVPRLRATARRLSVVLFSCALLRAEKVLVSCLACTPRERPNRGDWVCLALQICSKLDGFGCL